jgi:hypothetical protein
VFIIVRPTGGAVGLLAVEAGERVWRHAPPSVREKILEIPHANKYTSKEAKIPSVTKTFS